MHRQVVFVQPVCRIIAVNLKGRLAHHNLLVADDSTILALVFQQKEDVIRNFPVDLAQHTFVQLRGRQPYLEHLDFHHLLASSQIQGSGRNLIAPVDDPDLLDKGFLHSRGDSDILIELLLRDAFIKLGRHRQVQHVFHLCAFILQQESKSIQNHPVRTPD